MENDNESIKSKTIGGIFWSFGERIFAQIVSFIVSVVLARLLLPEQYGTIAIVTVLITLGNVFVTAGFSTSLIQKQNADDLDFSSVFYFGIAASVLLYILIFFASPSVASFYKNQELTPVIRVMSISLIISSVKSVEHAFVSRKMDFKLFFWSTLGGTIFSAVIGIFMAYKGFGVWALVGQYLSNNLIDTVILWFTVRWRPKLIFSLGRLKGLIAYGWKILASNLLFSLYGELRTLIIGKVYSSDDLAYYNKGQQFPNLIVNNVNSSISSALLPAMSQMQDDTTRIKAAIQQFVKIGTYIMMPVMCGMAAVAKPLVILLLTDKWIACVPYMQLMCISAAFLPLQTANTQAVMAYGRSDISLKTEIIKRSANILIIIVTFKISVMAMVLGELFSTFTSLMINTIVSKKLFHYGPWAQIRDMLPNIGMSLVMGAIVLLIGRIKLPVLLLLMIQIITGAIGYIGLSLLFKIDVFYNVLSILQILLKKIKSKT